MAINGDFCKTGSIHNGSPTYSNDTTYVFRSDNKWVMASSITDDSSQWLYLSNQGAINPENDGLRWNVGDTGVPDGGFVVDSSFWTPADITTLVWLDASDTGTITESGSYVSQWNDNSGNNNHAFNIIGNDSRPKTGIDLMGGENLISFTKDVLDITTPFTSPISAAHLVAAINVQDIIQGNTLLTLTGDDVSEDRWQMHVPWDDGILYFDVGGARASFQSGLVENQEIILSADSSTSTELLHIYIDGQNRATGSGHNHAPTSTIVKLGQGGFVHLEESVAMGEIIITDYVLSLAIRQKLEGYLAHKWGLTGNLLSNHPYKINKPRK